MLSINGQGVQRLAVHISQELYLNVLKSNRAAPLLRCIDFSMIGLERETLNKGLFAQCGD